MNAKNKSHQGRRELLAAQGITKYFGSMAALKDLDFPVFAGEIFGIAGPNGAGKTTLFNVISKALPLDRGKVWFDGRYIQGLPAHKICRLGIVRTFQIPALFGSLTIYRNALVGATFGYTNKMYDKEKTVRKVLNFVGLWEKRNTIAEELSLYERKVLMMASALATKPKLLMLDEPIAGLSQIEYKHVMELIKRINKEGLTVIIIEHNMDVLMGLSDRVMILHHGEKICEGPPRKVCEDERVIKAYLGEKYVGER